MRILKRGALSFLFLTLLGHEPAVAEQTAIPVPAADKGPESGPASDRVRSFLGRHCLECHGPAKARNDFRVDQLSLNLADKVVRDRWLTVLERLKEGTMPPESKPRPDPQDVQAVLEWFNGRLTAVQAARRATQGRVVLRRLNRAEYENTLRDLLGVEVDLKDLLPPDASADGFDNVGEALHTSSFLMEKYLEAADKALNVAIANGPQPPLVKKRLSCKDERHVKITAERVFRPLDDGLVFFTSSAWHAVTMSQFYPPDRGSYRFRICASAVQSEGKPVTFRVLAGPMLMASRNHLVGYFDAPADKPTVVEFVDRLEARSTINILPYGLTSAQAVNKVGAENWKGPGLAVQWVEVEGPLHDTWPPASHRRLFGDLPQVPAPVVNNRNRVEVASKDPEADAARLLRDFARRAFRRAVTEDDVKPFLNLVKARLEAKYSFERAMRVGLQGILVSPEFLFLRENPPRPSSGGEGKVRGLDDFALASRLSYFLWSTTPDDELLTLAEQGKLGQPDTLRQQVERLLKSPKASAFTENFVDQWLGLRDIDFTVPSHILYPEFDELLKVSMVKEAHHFFDEVLRNDLSLTHFVASDFSMLNGRLAKHYGIPGVAGYAFRKVALPPESHRGGVLTMASVLKVTANGTSTSPIPRGVWVLERILGTPPPKPPANVPAFEPDIRGATTIREQLAKHRQLASCASCHTRIDPPGFALESFDVIGGWRDHYRISGRGEPVLIDGRRMPYQKGPKVDPGDALPDGRKFRNIDEFKQLLLEDKDQLTRALAEKVLTYATGGAPEETDKGEMEAMVRAVRAKRYGFRSLIHEVVQSKLFQNK